VNRILFFLAFREPVRALIQLHIGSGDKGIEKVKDIEDIEEMENNMPSTEKSEYSRNTDSLHSLNR